MKYIKTQCLKTPLEIVNYIKCNSQFPKMTIKIWHIKTNMQLRDKKVQTDIVNFKLKK